MGSSENGALRFDSGSNPVVSALRELLKARDYARDLGREAWDLAVEMSLLSDLGLTYSDLRWLVCKGYVTHARDVTRLGDDSREFRPCSQLTFCKRTCFVLTDEGASFAHSLVSSELPFSPLQKHAANYPKNDGVNPKTSCDKPIRPKWDGERHELWVGDKWSSPGIVGAQPRV